MVETWQQIALGVLVLLVFASFVREWVSPEVVALAALVSCVLIGVLPIAVPAPDPTLTGEAMERAMARFRADALSVFSHPAPITIACMFVLSEALERTGVIESLGYWFEKTAAGSPRQMLVVMMVIVSLLSGFMNNTPVVVVFLPIVLAICRRKDWMASRYLIPLSYAAIVGGTITIIGTSTNLVAAGIAQENAGITFDMFSVTPLGLVFVAISFLYLLFFGKRVLPDRSTLATLIDSSGSREYITRAFVSDNSPLAGKVFEETWLKTQKKIRVLDVIRDGHRLRVPLTDISFQTGDEITLKGRLDDLMNLQEGVKLSSSEQLGLEDIRTESAVLMEGIIGPDSDIAGKSLKELNFRQRYGVIIVAVHRKGQNLRERFEEVKLAFGDTLLVQGPARRMQQLFELKDFVNLSEPQRQNTRPKKAPIAIFALLAFMVIGALGGFGLIPVVPIVLVGLSCALLVLLSRCVEPMEAYQAIDWKVLFLIFGMLGLGKALEFSGIAAFLANGFVNLVGEMPPIVIVGLIYLLAAVMTEMVSNNAVAVILTPLAIIVAQTLEVQPQAFIVAVMFGSSASFATPIGYQTNTFVYGAGGYKFGDFFRAGFPLAVILWLVASALIPLIWPL